MSSRRAALPLLALWLAACGPTAPADDDDDPIDAAIDAVDGRVVDAVDAPPDPDESRVYAHSGPMLYRIDTTTMAAVPVGAFTNLMANENMLDLALDRDERMIGVSRTRIFQIDPATAATTVLATAAGSNFTSLSFVPANIAQPDGPEVLIAATQETGDLVRIDITGTTATATVVGNYGTSGGTQMVSSGDLVYIRGVGILATVDIGPNSGIDYLATIDPANGWQATPIGTGTTFNNIFGVAFWGGTLYGFVDDGFAAATGKFIRLDRTTGTGTFLAMGPIRWFGAGVTTEAPLIP